MTSSPPLPSSDGVAPESEPRPVDRLITATGAMALAAVSAAVVIISAGSGDNNVEAVAWCAAVGMAALAVGLVTRLVSAVGVAGLALGAGYALGHLDTGAEVPASVLLLAPALLAMAEIAAWSIELSPPAANEPGVFGERRAWVAAATAGAAGLTLVLAGSSRIDLAGGTALDAVAVAAAVAVLGLAVVAARRGLDHR